MTPGGVWEVPRPLDSACDVFQHQKMSFHCVIEIVVPSSSSW